MKIGIRTPSPKKSITARTAGKYKRKLKRIANPFYGKAGTGWITNPKKAMYNKIYSKSTVSFKGVSGCLAACVFYPLYWVFMLYWYVFKLLFLGLYWLVAAPINGVIALVEWLINRLSGEPTPVASGCVPEQHINGPAANALEPVAHAAIFHNKDFIEKSRNRFIAFDVETTGLSPYSDKIIEISAVVFSDFTPVDSFSTLINPGIKIPETASHVNHITDEDVKDSPGEYDAITQFCEFIGADALNGDVYLVAHNAAFDIRFLMYALKRIGKSASLSYVDTLEVARKYIPGPENYKLGTVAKYLKIKQKNAHRALDDAGVCGEILSYAVKEINASLCAKQEELSQLDLDLCRWFKRIMVEHDINVQLLTFTGKAYLVAKCRSQVARFKTKGQRPYALIPSGIEIPNGLEFVQATQSEGEEMQRVFFSQPNDLDPLKEYYISVYKAALDNALEYMGESEKRMQIVADNVNAQISV